MSAGSPISAVARWARRTVPLLAAGWAVSCALEVPAEVDPLAGSVGLELRITDGLPTPVTVVPGETYHLDNLHIRALQTGFPTPEIASWMEDNSSLSFLDWSGLNHLPEHWEDAGDGTWSAEGTHIDAAWMGQSASVTLEIVDASGAVLAGPVVLEDDAFLMTRRTLLTWVDGAVAEGDLGGNTGSYAGQLDVSAGGSFLGGADDVVVIEVTTAGPLDGTARIAVSSVRGMSLADISVNDAAPIAVGQGVTVRFDELSSGAALVAGDRWTVYCDAETDVIGVPEPATRASFGAVASALYLVASYDTTPFTMPANAAGIEVTVYDRTTTIPVTLAPLPEAFGFGFGVELELVNPPPIGFYSPGETVEVAVQLTDGDGNPLHPQGTLPSYGDFLLSDAEYSGILYGSLTALNEPCSVPNNCRLDLMEIEVAGPKHLARVEHGDRDPTNVTTTRPGFYAGGEMLPEFDVLFGGYYDPAIWQATVPATVSITLPDDAQQGTYVALGKAGRFFRGERSYVMGTLEFQVGTELPSNWTSFTGCDVCHRDDAALSRLRHGAASDRSCQICHTAEHGTACLVIHEIHFASPIYPVRKNDCTLCHIERGSNIRASRAVCGACHGEIHPEEVDFDPDPNAACGRTCHSDEPSGHVPIPEL